MGRYNTDNIKEWTLDELLHYVSEMDIYRHFINDNIRLGVPMKCPYRTDDHPSFALYIARNGSIMWKDFASGDAGNVVKLVKRLTGLDYKGALQQIYAELVAGRDIVRKEEPLPTNSQPQRKKEISIYRKYFTSNDDKYWLRYYIDRTILKKFNVSPILTYWVKDSNGEWRQSPLFYTVDEPMYAYKVFNSYKIYRPLAKAKAYKWRGNLTAYDIQGFEQLPDKGNLLLITKSLKDVMVLYKLGYTAISPSSETTQIPTRVIEHLKTRFDKIIVFYDNDDPGMNAAKKLADKHNLQMIALPLDLGAKDISDYVELYGLTNAKSRIKSMLKSLNTKQ